MACFITKRWKFLTVLVVLIALPTVAGIIGWRHIQRNYNGEALAKLIMKGFNKNRRGRLELTSVTWQPRALFDVITGQPTYVVARGLKMYDVRGKKVVDVPLATGYVDVDPLRKNLSLVFENVKAHGGSISIEMFDSPDEKGRREIG
ncbi:hypothetical protein KJ865_00785, partial [Myxococcota bacterium]|nr:hypothetical protein [Myxococcota bacterium]